MEINALLDLAKSLNNIESDYRLAKILNVSQPTIPGYRAGRSLPDDKRAIQLANLAGLDPEKLVFEMHLARAKCPEETAFWADMLKKLGGVAATIFIGASIICAPNTAEANTNLGNSHTINYTTIIRQLGLSYCRGDMANKTLGTRQKMMFRLSKQQPSAKCLPMSHSQEPVQETPKQVTSVHPLLQKLIGKNNG